MRADRPASAGAQSAAVLISNTEATTTQITPASSAMTPTFAIEGRQGDQQPVGRALQYRIERHRTPERESDDTGCEMRQQTREALGDAQVVAD